MPLIKDLRKVFIFKDKTKMKGVSVTDLVLLVLQLLKKNFQAVVDFIKLVKLQDKGQLSYIVSSVYKNIGMWECNNILTY